VLLAVARHGIGTRAAHALNYAQPSVQPPPGAAVGGGRGTKLVQRAGRRYPATYAGLLLSERAVESSGGALTRRERARRSSPACAPGGLRLAASPRRSHDRAAAAAIPSERHPSVDLRLTEAEPPEIAAGMLRAGYVDVALVFRMKLPTAPAGPLDTRRPGRRGPTANPVPAPEQADLPSRFRCR